MWTVALEGPELIAQQAQKVLVKENWVLDSGEASQPREHPFLRCAACRGAQGGDSGSSRLQEGPQVSALCHILEVFSALEAHMMAVDVRIAAILHSR